MNEGRTLLVTCADSVLTYSLEGYRLCKVYKMRTSLSSAMRAVEVFGMEAYRFAVFDLSGQSLAIFSIMEPREPECTFNFAPIEKTVCVCWSDHSLYSLTKDGIVSKWKLLEKGRKLRESVWNFALDNCRKITGAGDGKFVISTVSNVINVSCCDCLV
ncbi:hypothetical protein DdX_13306 [Ditylenchus destructor]|uniref:Uncharacterized protein n=1 Tax=Ditylenchus destructor TaxID=166010 RepID=A0AAD4MTQ2_9BILA|nr:hypothetical protein DdX_13306 [Ditylenchus destructor]